MNNSQNNFKSDQNNNGNIKVVCRVRPFNLQELQLGQVLCVDFIDEYSIKLKTQQQENKNEKIIFNFDRVFNTECTQLEIYNFAAEPVVKSVLEGFNGTVFAYGQTSSGKTFTMLGSNIDDNQYQGIIPRMVNTVFNQITDSPEFIEFRIKVSIVEIYMEKIRDLLDTKKHNLVIREDKQRSVYIQDVTEHYVSNEQDVFNIMKIGNQNRAVIATNMNEGSSRSHLIFMLTISQNNLNDLSAKTGKLFLVDLAGSEKVAKTGAEGRVFDEAKTINQSLSSLGNVINALTDGKSTHVPYRNSKLTRILQESIGGNSRTTLIITCSPSSFNEAETLSTLRFGIRAKAINNKPKINREITVAELQMILAKTELELEDKKTRIIQLENYISQVGQSVPVSAIDGVECLKGLQQINDIDDSEKKNLQEINTLIELNHILKQAILSFATVLNQNFLQLIQRYNCTDEKIEIKDQIGQCKCADGDQCIWTGDKPIMGCPCKAPIKSKVDYLCVKKAIRNGCSNTKLECSEKIGQCGCPGKSQCVWSKEQDIMGCPCGNPKMPSFANQNNNQNAEQETVNSKPKFQRDRSKQKRKKDL
ncbi:kinesin heavy chain, putative [Ichthyophthirius multifiliis]|uniref:Kinesin-like protein n=1 Tax=Ichthyophthirius multifiliis TaxID=5932 RepID=G0QK15_ICHMU|nr:kinesin heavy chain, putative [Ichthyophthirius multifiliis]EGR34442.1 kinesin heavy chain, putative [Ichthyophthirius multifiliis]|eukprot:XP_004039746.1 kinesin heavy chain, putative [Ichthyophthirius multifiliis]